MRAKITGIVVSSVKRGIATGKRGQKLQYSTGITMVAEIRACGLPGLKLCSGNNGGRSPRSFYVSEVVNLRTMCFGATPPLFLYSSFCFLGPPGFGGLTKAAKGNRGLGSFKKKKREGAGSLVNIEYIVIKGQEVFHDVRLVVIPTGLVVIKSGVPSIDMRTISMGRWSDSSPGRVCHTQ